MGSTNKTQYLELPQWIGTDKPTFLGDFNDAFLKIDNGCNTINGTATTAGAQAGQAVEDATEALNKAESVEGIANTANTNANQALTTANNANTAVNNLTPRVTALENAQENLTLWSGGQMNAWSSLETVTAYAYYNQALELLNLYGRFTYSGSNISNSQTLFTLPNSILTYFSSISTRTIYAACSIRSSDGESLVVNFNLNNSGNITLTDAYNKTGTNISISNAGFNLMLNVSNW